MSIDKRGRTHTASVAASALPYSVKTPSKRRSSSSSLSKEQDGKLIETLFIPPGMKQMNPGAYQVAYESAEWRVHPWKMINQCFEGGLDPLTVQLILSPTEDVSCCLIKEYFDENADVPRLWLYRKEALANATAAEAESDSEHEHPSISHPANSKWVFKDAFQDRDLLEETLQDEKRCLPPGQTFVEGQDFLVYNKPLKSADFYAWIKETFAGDSFPDCRCGHTDDEDEQEESLDDSPEDDGDEQQSSEEEKEDAKNKKKSA